METWELLGGMGEKCDSDKGSLICPESLTPKLRLRLGAALKSPKIIGNSGKSQKITENSRKSPKIHPKITEDHRKSRKSTKSQKSPKKKTEITKERGSGRINIFKNFLVSITSRK